MREGTSILRMDIKSMLKREYPGNGHPGPDPDRTRDIQGKTMEFFKNMLGKRESKTAPRSIGPHWVRLVKPVEYERKVFRGYPAPGIGYADGIFRNPYIDFPMLRCEFSGVADNVPNGDFKEFPMDFPSYFFGSTNGYPRIFLSVMLQKRHNGDWGFFGIHFLIREEQQRLYHFS